MTFVVDASIAAKWFFPEEDSHLAEQLLVLDQPLYAPDLIIAEVTNVLWKHWRREGVDNDNALQIILNLPAAFQRLVTGTELTETAWHWSHTLDHPAYDCFYIACAEHVAGRMVTVDARLLAAVKGTDAGPLVCHLRDVVPA